MQNESLKNIVFEVNKIIKYYVNIIGVVGRGITNRILVRWYKLFKVILDLFILEMTWRHRPLLHAFIFVELM